MPESGPVSIRTVIPLFDAFRREVRKAALGVDRAIDLMLTALLAQGHVLLEDVPGVGKTVLAQAFARAFRASFRRIQFTSDMLPSDILGTHIWRPDQQTFEFREGPIFAHIVLADEINRANPKTQSALLEVMAERQVSLDHRVYTLPRPFFIVATQNPLEFQGTFPLPESQLDRFLMMIHLGYPAQDVETRILVTPPPEQLLAQVRPVASVDQIVALQEQVDRIRVHADILNYVVQLARATRSHPQVLIGASPRAGKHLVRAARAWAMMHGREYVVPDDIKTLAPVVWAHRLLPRAPIQMRATEWAVQLIREVLTQVPVPV